MRSVYLFVLCPLFIFLITAASADAGTVWVLARATSTGLPSVNDDRILINQPASAYAEYEVGDGYVFTLATGDFNHVGVESFADGPGDAETFMTTNGFGQYLDTLHAFDSDGNELTEGNLAGSFHVHGSLNGNARVSFSWEYRGHGDEEGGGGGQQWGALNTNGPPIDVDELVMFEAPLSPDGVVIEMTLSAQARTNSLAASGHVQFLSSATIASIFYVDPNGIPDLTVQIRGDAGYVYPTPAGAAPVPEPASLTLFGMGLIGSSVLARRKRRTAA